MPCAGISRIGYRFVRFCGSGDFNIFATEECMYNMAGSCEPATGFAMALCHSDRLCIHFKRYCTAVTLAGFCHFNKPF